MRARKLIWLPILAILAFLFSACGSSASNESVIATSVALTVQAQNALTKSAPTPTKLPTATRPAGATVLPTLTNIFTPANPTAAGGSKYAACAKASLVSENYPDGSIFSPDQGFYKTWQIRNDSNCTWDTSYKIVYWSGDLMGGPTLDNFPQSATPGMVFDFPLYLVAPKETGSYRGEWMFQTPDGIFFGVGEYNQPIWADITVSTDEKPDYHITSVTYRLERDPVAGCATSVRYYVYATIATNGPLEVRVQWVHKDGWTSSKIKLTFTEAGTQEIQDLWGFHLGDTPGDKWIQLRQVDPVNVEFDKVTFSYLCGN